MKAEGRLCLPSAAMLCFAGIRTSTSATELLVYICIGAAILNSIAIGLNLYTAEIFPTPFRAFASSVAGAWQRAAAALGPLVVAALLPGGIGQVLFYFAAMALIGGIVTALFAIETKQRLLEDI